MRLVGGGGGARRGKRVSYLSLQKHAPHLLSYPDLHTEAVPLRHIRSCLCELPCPCSC
jgi:hypothetical protein